MALHMLHDSYVYSYSIYILYDNHTLIYKQDMDVSLIYNLLPKNMLIRFLVSICECLLFYLIRKILLDSPKLHIMDATIISQ